MRVCVCGCVCVCVCACFREGEGERRERERDGDRHGGIEEIEEVEPFIDFRAVELARQPQSDAR